MAKKRKSKKSTAKKKTKLRKTMARKTKVKRKRTSKNEPEKQPNQDVGTPEPTVTELPPIPTGFGPNSATTPLSKYKLIMDHLAQTEAHVVQGASHVKRQRQLLKDLAHDGHDTTGSSALLNLFKDLHDLHVQDRDRLRAELADVMRKLPGTAQHKGLA
jgi:hypothetical protein